VSLASWRFNSGYMEVQVDTGTSGTPPSGGNLEMNPLPPEGGVPINALF
jgi:hypothetical protein